MTSSLPKIDPTKSKIWLSIDRKTQEEIIKLCSLRKRYEVMETEDMVLDEQDIKTCYAIHEALGCKSGHHALFIFELERRTGFAEGGVFEPIKEYIEKYRTVENAAVTIAKKRALAPNNQFRDV